MHPEASYYCNVCDGECAVWRPRCPSCGALEGMRTTPEPIAQIREADGRYGRVGVRHIAAKKPRRLRTHIEGLDRVMGAEDPGFVIGSTTLFGGGQGSGKSTLIAQALAGMARDGAGPPTLMVMNEEPPERLRLRADRVGITERLDHVEAIEEKTFAGMRDAILERQPRVVVVDSLSMMVDPESDTGDVQGNQKRYLQWLFTDAEAHSRVTILIVHLNKENDFAGARYLQYLVDANVRIQKISKRFVRLDCPDKNRFGDPSEQAFFRIDGKGLHQIERVDPDDAPVADYGVGAIGDDPPLVQRLRGRGH